jgi:Chromo (CHRromatin Organisation MOdifier) domain
VAYELKIPDSLKIHPVFHVSRLKQYIEPTDHPGRPPVAPPPPPETIESEIEYEVEWIMDHRKRKNRLEYLVKWKGYPAYEASWEPITHLSHAQETVKEYELLRGRSIGEGGIV